MKQSTPAIVMKRVAYGEADWIVTFYSRDHGRLSGIAKSGRASRRRFGGALELGSIVQMSYTRRPPREMVRLEEAQVSVPMNGALRSLERIGGLSRALALALAVLQENAANPEKFDVLRARLAGLCVRDPEPFESAAFELRWLALCGYAPVLDRCAGCGVRTEEGTGWAFEFDRGGFVCRQCSGDGPSVRLTAAAHRGLCALAQGDYDVDELSAAAAGELLGRYIDHVLGRPLAVR